MTDFYSQNRCVCSTRSHGPLLCAFCLSFHFNGILDGVKARRHDNEYIFITIFPLILQFCVYTVHCTRNL